MGRLSGFRYRDVVRRLRPAGFLFDRHAAGSHEIGYDARRLSILPGRACYADSKGVDRIIGDGQGVRWPELDEDLSAGGFLAGVPARRPVRPSPAVT